MQSTLSQYVKKRNGVPLGAKGSMRNMLLRSFGAPSFPVFWHYWNPIWGYYLSRNIMRPLSALVPMWLAVFTTFLVSGALHDLAVALVHWKPVLFFTPWFGCMGALVIVSNKYALSYGFLAWPVRALLNILFILLSLALTYLVMQLVL